MKKLLLIPLLALFTCVNMWGANVSTNLAGLQAAIDAAEAGDVITLTASGTLPAAVTINKAITLDLGGYTITNASSGKKILHTTANATIRNGKVNVGGIYGVVVDAGTLSLENVSFNNGTTSRSAKAILLTANNTAIALGANVDLGIAPSQGNISVKKETTYGATGSWATGDKVSIIANSEYSNLTVLCDQDKVDVEFVCNAPLTLIEKDPSVTTSTTYTRVYNASKSGASTLSLQGGRYGLTAWAKLKDFVADEYTSYYTFYSSSPYPVLAAVVPEGSVPATANEVELDGLRMAFKDALYAAKSGQTIKLMENNPTTVGGDVRNSCTIDLNGNTITNAAIVIKGGTVTVKSTNGTGTLQQKAGGDYNVITLNTSTTSAVVVENSVRLLPGENSTGALIKVSKATTSKAAVTLNEGVICESVLVYGADAIGAYVNANDNACVVNYQMSTSTYLTEAQSTTLLNSLNTSAQHSSVVLTQGNILKSYYDANQTAFDSYIQGTLSDVENKSTMYKKVTPLSATTPAITNSDETVFANLNEAFNWAIANSGTLKLTADFTISNNITNFNGSLGDQKVVTLDLNGHTLTTAPWLLKNCNLTITGEGTIKAYAANQVCLFQLRGDFNTDAADYTKLSIGSDITLKPDNNGYAIAIQPANNGGSTSYGVKVDLAGSIDGGYGISINGNVQAHTPTGTGHVPTINISGSLSSSVGAPVYAAGYGIWNINNGANLQGTSGFQIKSGKLNINNGATIHGVMTEGQRVEAYNNGMYESGAALQIESNANYAGEMEIVIADGATLKADGWYAIHEYVANANDPTKVKSIAVNGGNFTGGILISQSLAAKGGFVSGGTWSVDVAANCAAGFTTTKVAKDEYSVVDAGSLEKKETTEQTVALVADDSSVETDKDKTEKVNENNTVVVTTNTDVVATETASKVEVKKVTVEEGNTLTVTEGAILQVGAGAVHLDEEAQLTVEAGASLVVEGLVYGANEDNFVIETNEDKPGVVLFSPETEFITEDHPQATYKFKSKGRKLAPGQYIWQRLGIPTFDGGTTIHWDAKIGDEKIKTALYDFDYTSNDWNLIQADANDIVIASADGKPFQCYAMTIDQNPAEDVEYTFTGALMGNTNAPLNFVKGWNYYANSYTAPIDIYQFIDSVKNYYKERDEKVSATVYVYNRSTDWWDPSNFSLMLAGDAPTQIKPMQAFIMELVEGESALTKIDYKGQVYEPFVAKVNENNGAPHRVQRTSDFNSVIISATNGTENDKLVLFESPDLSDEFDNGWDATKFSENKQFTLYCELGDKQLGTLATNDLSNKHITLDAKVAGEFTLTFSNAKGDEIKLYDAVADSLIVLTSGESYKFQAEAIKDAERFIINPKEAPSAIENNEDIVIVTKYIGTDGQLYIRRAGKVYNVQGKEVR